MCVVLVFLLLNTSVFSYRKWTIYDRIMQDQEFSGYRTMIKSNKNVLLNLKYTGVTVFAPDNDAVDSYDGFFEDGLVLYHMGSEMYTLRDLTLNNKLESVYRENPPIWVTVVPDQGYYINNAKIIEDKSNYVARCKDNLNSNQVLHVIDRVVDPMLDTPYTDPSAFDFLENHQNWKLGSRKVSNFFKRVQFNKKQDLFKKTGGHTFFVPIDDKRHDHRLENIDSEIIEGHVIPHMVLFTRPAAKSFVYETAANGDFVYIVLSLVEQNDKMYVKSHTVLGNSDHKKGEILAEIVKANIPVTNGVVHLISQPLAVFDRELKPFPYLSVWYKISADPDLNITYTLGQGTRINKILRERGVYTYFVPRNKSWRDYLGYSNDELSDILGRHLVVSDTRYTMSKLATTSRGNGGTNLDTLAGRLKIDVVYTNGTYFLIWGQKWIKVIRPNYECTDGVVHIIDDVFATPNPPKSTPPPRNTNFWKSLKNMVT